MDLGVGVVALLARRPAVRVFIGVAGGAVAVVVGGVRAVVLVGAGVEGLVRVVAVATQLGVAAGLLAGLGRGVVQAVAVRVGVQVPGGEIDDVVVLVVLSAVAVVVHAVADLVGVRVHRRVVVVAVPALVGEPVDGHAAVDGAVVDAPAVLVGVGVPRAPACFVDLAVAVVVDLVADLLGARVGCGVVVIAVVVGVVAVAVLVLCRWRRVVRGFGVGRVAGGRGEQQANDEQGAEGTGHEGSPEERGSARCR